MTARMIQRLPFFTVFAFLFTAATAQQPGEFVGAQVCGSCHSAQFESQSKSGHARTLHRAPNHPLAGAFVPERPLRREPNFRFRFKAVGEQIIVSADDGEYVMELPLEWAFGAGDHGITFVSRLDKNLYLEHAFSYYADIGSLDITTGHEKEKPETLHQAMGMAYPVEGEGQSIAGCFRCHSTGGLSFSGSHKIDVAEKGVRCEVCHGPGRAHVKSVSGGKVELARRHINNPRRMSAGEMNQFCGTCHRVIRDDGPEFDFETAWNVRHQPPYLSQSACFRKSSGRLSCITCHNPHEAVRRNEPGFYRAKCVSCHDTKLPPSEICTAATNSDCTSCHMPKVKVSAHLAFKNHWIGVYSAGNRLTPSR